MSNTWFCVILGLTSYVIKSAKYFVFQSMRKVISGLGLWVMSLLQFLLYVYVHVARILSNQQATTACVCVCLSPNVEID